MAARQPVLLEGDRQWLILLPCLLIFLAFHESVKPQKKKTSVSGLQTPKGIAN